MKDIKLYLGFVIGYSLASAVLLNSTLYLLTTIALVLAMIINEVR